MARALCDTGYWGTVHRILVRECSGPGRPVWPLEQRMRVHEDFIALYTAHITSRCSTLAPAAPRTTARRHKTPFRVRPALRVRPAHLILRCPTWRRSTSS
eukprot:scaffold2668_cov115-Isochrysis_galbana.AAC.5